jgi:hypothetical protein
MGIAPGPDEGRHPVGPLTERRPVGVELVLAQGALDGVREDGLDEQSHAPREATGAIANLLTPTIVRAQLCRARTRIMALSWCFLCSSGCSPILVDQPVDDLPAPDPGCHIDRLAGLVQRRSLFPRLVGSVVVAVLRVLAEDLAELSFTIDQEVAGALAP